MTAISVYNKNNTPASVSSSDMFNMEAVTSTEKLVSIYQVTHRHIPGCLHIHYILVYTRYIFIIYITAARLLQSWVRIPPGGMDVFLLCVLSGRGLRDGLITRPEESYRLWLVVVCDKETS
jgi:hypothetical protein